MAMVQGKHQPANQPTNQLINQSMVRGKSRRVQISEFSFFSVLAGLTIAMKHWQSPKIRGMMWHRPGQGRTNRICVCTSVGKQHSLVVPCSMHKTITATTANKQPTKQKKHSYKLKKSQETVDKRISNPKTRGEELQTNRFYAQTHTRCTCCSRSVVQGNCIPLIKWILIEVKD
jgi:hypothetical protein